MFRKLVGGGGGGGGKCCTNKKEVDYVYRCRTAFSSLYLIILVIQIFNYSMLGIKCKGSSLATNKIVEAIAQYFAHMMSSCKFHLFQLENY